MTNSITLPIDRKDGSTFDVIIQAEHSDEKGYGIEHATVFSIWATVDARLGYMIFSKEKKYWRFDGNLSEDEQKQIAYFLQKFKESDWEL